MAAAEAVKISLETFTSTIEDMADGKKVEVECLTGDSGGGAAVQRLHPALVNLSIMDELSRYVGCDMHGMNKPLEVASVEVFGKQGIGVETPFQMLWLFVQLFKKVRDEYSHDIMNEMWATIVDSLRNDGSLQQESREQCLQVFEDIFGKLEELETVTGKDEDKIEEDFNTAFKMAYEALTILADPVFSRWSTMLKCVEVFIDNYIVIYHFVQAIKQT